MNFTQARGRKCRGSLCQKKFWIKVDIICNYWKICKYRITFAALFENFRVLCEVCNHMHRQSLFPTSLVLSRCISGDKFFQDTLTWVLKSSFRFRKKIFSFQLRERDTYDVEFATHMKSIKKRRCGYCILAYLNCKRILSSCSSTPTHGNQST